MKLAPSILAGDLANVAAELRAMESAGCDAVHWDVMDGHFVPNLTFGVPLLRAARGCTELPFDVHLMVTNPADYFDPLADGLGVSMVSFQREATEFTPRLCAELRKRNIAPSVVLNPHTPLAAIEDALELVDNVLLMSVDPGFAGQPFIEAVWAKIERLADLRATRRLRFSIQVDGGVTEANLPRLAGLGVDNVVAGKAYFSAEDRGRFVRSVHHAKAKG